jgi:uncharacterized protein (TIGR02444 family)
MYDATAATALWDFALGAYARPGVSPLCLELQDRHGANVMLMLHLCHCATAGHEPGDPADVAAAMAPLEQHLVAPLRRARRVLSASADALGSEALRTSAKRVSQSELAAERLQCLRVEPVLARAACVVAPRGTAQRLLLAYFRYLGPHAQWQSPAAASLAEAVFPL